MPRSEERASDLSHLDPSFPLPPSPFHALQYFDRFFTMYALVNTSARSAVDRSGMLVKSAQLDLGAAAMFATPEHHACVLEALELTDEQRMAAATLYEVIQVCVYEVVQVRV